MRNDSREQSKTGRLPLATIGIILFVLVLFGGCGGAFFLFNNMRSNLESQAKDVPAQMNEAEKIAQAFCVQVGVGDLQAAYAQTSAAFKQKIDPEALAKFAEDQSTLLKPIMITLDKKTLRGGIGIPNLNADGARITMAGSLQNANGRATVSVELVKESGIWKVDELECAGVRIPAEGSTK